MEEQYADADGISLAYRIMDRGGSHDMVMVSGGFFAVEQLLEDRVSRRFLDGVADLGRLVLFDRRGIGLSDPIVDWERSPFEQWADDLAAIIEVAGLDAPTVIAWDGFFGIGRATAASRPDLVGGLVLLNPLPTMPRPEDWGDRAAVSASVDDSPSLEEATFPSRIDEPGFREWLDRAGRIGASPGVASRLWEVLAAHDDLLTPAGIECPTLVLHREDCVWSHEAVRAVVDAIDGAQLVAVPGVDAVPLAGDVDALVAEITRFVTGATVARAPERITAAVLFMDLVASTDRTVDLGDSTWSNVLDRHDEIVASALGRVGGEVVKFTGDGVLALVPSVHGAVVAAHQIQARLSELDLKIRAGVHVGDIDRRGDDVSGITVNVSARIMDGASDGQILLSDPAARAMLGAKATLVEERTEKLKGVPGEWTLWRSDHPPPS